MDVLREYAGQRAAGLVAEAHRLLDAGTDDAQMRREAAPAAIAAMFGVPATDPVAGSLARRGISEMAAMLTEDDFGHAFKTGLASVIAVEYDRSATHRKIVRMITVPTMCPVPMVDIDLKIDEELDRETKEHGEAESIYVNAGDGESLALTRKSLELRFSPELIKNDTMGSSSHVVSQFVAACIRRERRAVFSGILGGNPALADARALYNTTDGNDLGGAATLSLSTLGDGIGALARQKTKSGNESGAEPAYLLVAPEEMITALSVIRQITVDSETPKIEVIPANQVASGAWYLFADPAVAPVIGFGVLDSEQGGTIKTRTGTAFRSSSLAVAFDHIFGAAVLSRVGTVRGGV